ncbi:uncharacterized protein C8Q71DRAFT_341389 [Rhodofomes roseus]|uniref:Secreted protein n=1 Tax=Rhodofomes roseus TaxID=34475 RepID=A0ABQ8KS54_9APHY|nr:uncharacterized protein C8Q71DRAFT_341389 [Rhodofomes roseus]KAH9841638.1 hypothetical protein C8Q71DRAFT_341389 [Rhodofomes roseus]
MTVPMSSLHVHSCTAMSILRMLWQILLVILHTKEATSRRRFPPSRPSGLMCNTATCLSVVASLNQRRLTAYLCFPRLPSTAHSGTPSSVIYYCPSGTEAGGRALWDGGSSSGIIRANDTCPQTQLFCVEFPTRWDSVHLMGKWTNRI